MPEVMTVSRHLQAAIGRDAGEFSRWKIKTSPWIYFPARFFW